ncbi:alkaline-phosphatase-like protein [Pelagophyceae sp. CCMP2097]|nr:alkaline-phosphatase-like protein [Pelagophyceae sp. CCMP2097]|mmetsp:Transcript_14012/g.49790  ORF Transcript_14012/g.49790 Transcript_14012/m.49790 type:complete len:613 (+) Transcript_14012:197-2035(+)
MWLLIFLACAARAAAAPSVVFLMCDSFDGRVIDPTSPVSRRVSTPALDDLALSGVNFVRSYSPSPQCVPARVSMLTGLRPDQHRAFDNGHGLAADDSGKLDEACVAAYDAQLCESWAAEQLVRKTLFDVALDFVPVAVFGKLDVGANAQARWGAGTSADGFHEGPNLAILTRGADIRRATKPDPLAITNEADDLVHPEDWRTVERCEEWLSNNVAPFLLHCSLNIPHPDFQTNETWLARVNRELVRRTLPTWLEPDGIFNATSLVMHPYDVYASATKAVSRRFSKGEVATVREAYYAMCAETDSLLGRVVERLRATGGWEDAFVIFTSDHGEMNMDHRQVWKNSMYEASVRIPLIIGGGLVPLIIGGGLIKKRGVVFDLVSLLDVFPTINAMLGVADPKRPAGVDLAGDSLLPYLVNGTAPKPFRSAVVSQYHSCMGSTGAFMVRSGRWKYVRFATKQFAAFRDYKPQLFDVEADPDELFDVALIHADVLQSLEAALQAELSTGPNRISSVGDPEDVDRYAMRVNRNVYARFFLDVQGAAKQWQRVVDCARNPPRRADDPEREAPCANVDFARARNLSAASGGDLRRLFEAAYSGFDDADMAKVDAWFAADP